MSRRRTALLAAVLPLGLLVPLAHAQSTSPSAFVPVTPTTQVYLTCPAGNPAKEQTTSEVRGGAFATWAEGPAPASVTTGAGCGKVDDGLFGGADFQTPYQFAFGGTYTGNVDALTVTLHSVHVAPGRETLEPVDLDVRMTVDGVSMFGTSNETGATGDVFTIPAGRVVTVTPTATGATGGVTAYTFTVKGLDLLLEKDNTVHDVQFDVAVADLGLAEGWLWGAAEAPTGAVLNPEAPARAVLTADARAVREAR